MPTPYDRFLACCLSCKQKVVRNCCACPCPGDTEQAEWLESHAASLQEVSGLLSGGQALAKYGLDVCVAELKEADMLRAVELVRTLLGRAER